MTDIRLTLAWIMATGLALSGPVLPLFTLPPPTDGIVLVVAPPWHDAAAIIDTAGGRLVGPATTWLGAFATSDAADFAERLRAAGAWASLNGTALAELCGWKT